MVCNYRSVLMLWNIVLQNLKKMYIINKFPSQDYISILILCNFTLESKII